MIHGVLLLICCISAPLTVGISQLVSRLQSSCAPNADPFQPLSYSPSGMNFYPGPNSSVQNSCTCSYVMYNLMSGMSIPSHPRAHLTYVSQLSL
jgi:hypothetical protein